VDPGCVVRDMIGLGSHCLARSPHSLCRCHGPSLWWEQSPWFSRKTCNLPDRLAGDFVSYPVHLCLGLRTRGWLRLSMKVNTFHPHSSLSLFPGSSSVTLSLKMKGSHEPIISPAVSATSKCVVENENVELRELMARFSIWSTIGIQFSITATPLAVGSYLAFVQGVGGYPFFVYGFIAVAVFQLILCVSMAEIAAVYPHTSGTFVLQNLTHRRSETHLDHCRPNILDSSVSATKVQPRSQLLQWSLHHSRLDLRDKRDLHLHG
jgi:hypothetical protein